MVTVHGPVNPAVPPEAAVRETRAVLGRIEAGRLHPRSGFELSYAIVSALAEGQEGFVERVTRQVWPLEQRVTSGHLGDPEQFLEELFGTRHALLAVSNMAALGHQLYRRMSALARFIPPDCQPLVADLEDQFDRVAGVADGQVRYREGVIEFYKARTDTKVTIAAERLALIAVLTLPITALSRGLTNYWEYDPIGLFAPHEAYSARGAGGPARRGGRRVPGDGAGPGWGRPGGAAGCGLQPHRRGQRAWPDVVPPGSGQRRLLSAGPR